MRVKIVTFASGLLLLAGVDFARALPLGDAPRAARAEMLCGSFLAAGLVLMGVGLHASFG